MKLGAESRNKTIAAVALGVLAAYMVWHSFFGGGPVIASPPPTPAQPTATLAPLPNKPGKRPRFQTVTAPAVNPLDPRLELALLKNAEDTEYHGSGRNIFMAEAEAPIPTPHGNGLTNPGSPTPKPAPQPPPGPPQPPPIPLKFFGTAVQPGQPHQVFLSEGEYVFVAKEGDVVDRRYKILRINPTSVVVKDLLNNNTQTIQLVAGAQ